MTSYGFSPSNTSIPAQTSFVSNSGQAFVRNSPPAPLSFSSAPAQSLYSSSPSTRISSAAITAPLSFSPNNVSGVVIRSESAAGMIRNEPIIGQTAPIQTVEEIRGVRNIKVPVQRQVRTTVPVQKAIKTQVPVQRAVHGTKDVVTHVTVNKPKVEVITRMVPVQEKRVVNVPSVETRIQKVPTVNYVTEMQEKVNYVTEMKEQFNTVTDYETRTIPTIQRRIRTRYETVEDLPVQDDAEATQFSASNQIAAPAESYSNGGQVLNLTLFKTAPTLNVLSNTSGSAALYAPTMGSFL